MKIAIRTQSDRSAICRKTNVISLARYSTLALLAAGAALVIAPGEAAAEPGPAGLAGSWSGGGWVSFASGSKERARCKVRYTAQSATHFRFSGTCATESGRVSQTATVRKSGANSYAGSFHNSEYDVSGSIRVVVRGNSQTATLTSGSGSAVLTLSR